LAAISAGPALAVPAGESDPVLGRWDVTVSAPDGSQFPSWFDIALRTENELMGRMVGRFGSTRYASAVTFNDGKLSLRVPRQYESGPAELQFDGILADGALSGTTIDEHGATLRWSAQRAPVLPRPAAPHWGKPLALWNGTDLKGWTQQGGGASCWQVGHGVLANTSPCRNLISTARFKDFKLHVEFMNVAGGNSGLYLRGRYEVQLNDAYGQAPDALRSGAVYGHLRPQLNATLPAGQWQNIDVTLLGRYVTVVLNGKTIIEDQEIPGITGGALDSREAEDGPVMLQGDHTAVSFRKVVLTPLLAR